ncbi:MAG: alginate lyase family protein [Vicinamibacterales bacterium]
MSIVTRLAKLARMPAKLARMPADEMAGRGRMAAARHADWMAWTLRRPQWDRADLAGALDPSATDLHDARRCLEAADWTGAHARLSSWVRERPRRFPLAPASQDSLVALIRDRFPDAAADAARRADRALAGRLDILGYRDVRFARADRSDRIDWHRDPVHGRTAPRRHWSRVPYLSPRIGDHKVIWELNRHQHWLTLGRAYWLTGDHRYRDGFVRQLEDWLRENPPETGVNWSSMLELALRSLSWIWALHFFAGRPASADRPDEAPWTVDLLLGLDRQLRLVEQHLSTWFSPNTHLIGEALALYVAGRVLPEFSRAQAWADTGRRVLLGEIERQVKPDGGHAELSMHYHRYTLDFYLLALSVATLTGDTRAIVRFHDAVTRLARFARVMADTHDRLPLIGDDDGGSLFPICTGDTADAGPSLALAAAVLDAPGLAGTRPHEEVAWMYGALPVVPPTAPSHGLEILPDSGYAVSRTTRGDHLVMDVGALGYLNGGHAHADALSVVLTVAGRPLFIDPGTACYTVDRDRRDRFRSTGYHNTAVLDGRSQSTPAGPFGWSSSARASLDCWRSTPAFDFIEGSHDGYGPGGHRRQVLARPGCWIVVDWIAAPHDACAVHWHLHPAWDASSRTPRRIGVRQGRERHVWILAMNATFEPVTGGGGDAALGWCAPAYGDVRPTTSLRLTPTGQAPYPVVTIVTDRRGDAWLEPLEVSGPDGAPADGAAFRWHANDVTETVIVAPPGGVQRERCAGGYGTDVRWLTVRQRHAAGSPRCGGSRARPTMRARRCSSPQGRVTPGRRCATPPSGRSRWERGETCAGLRASSNGTAARPSDLMRR